MASEGIDEEGGSVITLDPIIINGSDDTNSLNKASNKNATLNIAPDEGEVLQSYLDKITAGKKINISL